MLRVTAAPPAERVGVKYSVPMIDMFNHEQVTCVCVCVCVCVCDMFNHEQVMCVTCSTTNRSSHIVCDMIYTGAYGSVCVCDMFNHEQVIPYCM